MDGQPLLPGTSMPLLVAPTSSIIDLISLAKAERNGIRDSVERHGAILFRGFDIDSPAKFQDLVASLSDELLDYTERSTPRKLVQGKVYTSTEYPPHATIPLHCEMSYTTTWPRLLWFFCEQPAEEGGETPIADARLVYEYIKPITRDRFLEKGGVMYVRNFYKSVDLPWQEVYGVATRSELVAYCKRSGIELEWKEDGVLRTSHVCQAVAEHPATGEIVWMNQAHLFNVRNLESGVREWMLKKFKVEGSPRNSYYGDGTPIEDEVLAEIAEAYDKAEIIFEWERGDVLMIDNMLVAHGRRPFKGRRRVLVAMAESHSDAK